MDARDVARVLAKAAAFDQRTVGQTDLLAWSEAIGDLDPADALAAVTRHYRETSDRLMPVHVRWHAETIRRERHRAARLAAEERAALEAAPVRDRSAEIAAQLAQLRHVLPPGDPAALKPRAAYWEREYRLWQRQQTAEPNPRFDPEIARQLAALPSTPAATPPGQEQP